MMLEGDKTQLYKVLMACGHIEHRRMRPATAGIPWSPEAIVETPRAECKACRDSEFNAAKGSTFLEESYERVGTPMNDKAIARIASRIRKKHAALTYALEKADLRLDRAKAAVYAAEHMQRTVMKQLSEVGVNAFEELDRVRRERNVKPR